MNTIPEKGYKAWKELCALAAARAEEPRGERPPVEFGQVWHVRDCITRWLPSAEPRPVLFPVVIIEPRVQIGMMTACKVLCIHEFTAYACSDDLLLTGDDGTGERPMVVPLWLCRTLFHTHLEECIGQVSERIQNRLRYWTEHPNTEMPAEWVGDENADEPEISETRGYVREQAAVYDIPVEEYRAVWRKTGEVLTQLDVAEAQQAIALREEIEHLTADGALSPELISASRVAGGDSLDFGALTPERIMAELSRIDKDCGPGSIQARRARIAFLHKCFVDTLEPEVLSMLEKELDEQPPDNRFDDAGGKQ